MCVYVCMCVGQRMYVGLACACMHRYIYIHTHRIHTRLHVPMDLPPRVQERQPLQRLEGDGRKRPLALVAVAVAVAIAIAAAAALCVWGGCGVD